MMPDIIPDMMKAIQGATAPWKQSTSGQGVGDGGDAKIRIGNLGPRDTRCFDCPFPDVDARKCGKCPLDAGPATRIRRQPINADQLRELWEKGLSDHEIAAAMDVKYSTVAKRRYKLGLPPNKKGEKK